MRYAHLRRMIVGTAVVWLILGWVSVALSAQIKLAWDANTEPDLAGYKIYYGTASHSYGTPTNVGKVTSYTLTGLTAGQTYYLSLTAYDSSSNESGQSNEVSGVATNPSQTVAVTIAATPTGRQITVDGTTSTAPQTFNWTAGSSHTIGVSSPQNGTSGTRYAFGSWSDGGAQTHTITAPSSAATYTATFTTQYTLTASASTGGTVSPSGTNWYNSSQSVSVTATPNTGYGFSNWSGDFTGNANPLSFTMNGPKSVTANFTQSQYTLTLTANPAGSGSVAKSPNKAAYVYGEQVTLTATPNSNYSFVNWSGDLTGATNPAVLTMDRSKAVTANFSAISGGALSITPSNGFNSSGKKGGPFDPTSFTYTLNNSGGTAIDWAASNSQNWVSLSATSGTLSPGGSAPITVSINANANGLAVGTHDDTVTFTNTTNHNGDATRPVKLTVAAGDFQTHKIATNPGGLSIDVDGIKYKSPKKSKWEVGSLHTISVTSPQEPVSGKRYQFTSWSDGGSVMHDVAAPPDPTTYTANFITELSLKTSVNNESRGTVSPSGTEWYEKGEAVSITATPGVGYQFKNWTDPTGAVVIGKTNPLSVTMNGVKRIKANFIHISYPLVVNKIPPAGGTVSKTPSKMKYFHGEQVTLTAKPKYAYTFSGWGGDATGTESTITITVDGQKTVTASFAEDPDVPRVAQTTAKTQGRLPLIGQLESPGDGKTLSGVKPIYGWALDGEAVTKVELFIDGHYVCRIPYGGLREDLRERHPTYPGAEQAGFALVWNYSVLSAGEHSVGIRVHNARGEALDLSSKVSVVKFHGDLVTDMNPDTPYSCPVTVTADGVTRTYEVNLQWVSEIQDFGIIEIVPKD